MVNCSNCGYDVGDSVFCPNCGTKVEIVEEDKHICLKCGADVGKSKFCPNCGTKVEIVEETSLCPNCGNDVGDSAFCPNCGTKIEKESPKHFCPNCGNDVGDNAFCPECGTRIADETSEHICPSCGKSFNESSKFCPYCGWSESSNESSQTVTDKILELDNKFSKKLGNRLKKSKAMDSILDKTVSLKTNHIGNASDNAVNRKYYENIEPVFLEVYDKIEDPYVKDVFMIMRTKFDSTGGLGGFAVSVVDTPTKGMPHDEGVQFYEKILNDLINEINQEKQNGTFDENEFYKRKVKESSFENISAVPILRALKSRK